MISEEQIPLSKPKKGASGETGRWRTEKPVLDKSRCTNCLLCWIYCPEGAIVITEDKVEINYDYCKGCGVCANECARGAIKMEDE